MADFEPTTDIFAQKAPALADIPAPRLNYQPPAPRTYRPRIGLIGAGGIAACHLDAYRSAGWEVAAISSRDISKAKARAEAFAPGAIVTGDYQDILRNPDIDVVDITPFPSARLPIIESALNAGKHVLSQKPFVENLNDGERLVALARQRGVKLAVNQNGRWAPHLSWMREAVRAGLIGELVSAHISIHFNQNWIAGTSYEETPQVILSDFGIHWFDFLASLCGGRVRSIFATSSTAVGQSAAPPLLGQALVRLDGGQATFGFDGSTWVGQRDTTFIAGTRGALYSEGPDLGNQVVTLTTREGRARPQLEGTWFNDGFRGAMGALLVAIENDAEPENGAAGNLLSLAICFAATESSRSGREVEVGAVRQVTL